MHFKLEELNLLVENSLSWECVEDWSNVFSFHNWNWEICWAAGTAERVAGKETFQ